MTHEAVSCPFCASRNVRATLPATAQFFEYRCRECKRSWFTGSLTASAGSPSMHDASPDDEAEGEKAKD